MGASVEEATGAAVGANVPDAMHVALWHTHSPSAAPSGQSAIPAWLLQHLPMLVGQLAGPSAIGQELSTDGAAVAPGGMRFSAAAYGAGTGAGSTSSSGNGRMNFNALPVLIVAANAVGSETRAAPPSRRRSAMAALTGRRYVEAMGFMMMREKIIYF